MGTASHAKPKGGGVGGMEPFGPDDGTIVRRLRSIVRQYMSRGLIAANFEPIHLCRHGSVSVTASGDLLPATIVACRADRHPVAKIDPQFRCRRDGATAQRVLLAPGMQRLQPQVRKF